MKKTIKVFIIIGMVVTFYLVYPIVLGAIVLKKMNDGFVDDKQRITWSVLTLVFVSAVAGVLMLCMQEPATISREEQEKVEKQNFVCNNLDELSKIYELKTKGILTEEEFNQKKKEILGRI